MEATKTPKKPKKPFCAKHKAEYDRWSDWGPWNPRPKTISQATVDSQLTLIKTVHENGNACSDNKEDAFS